MNILETTTYPNYQNYQKSSVTSFKANETGGQTGGGSSILLGTVAAASAAVAGVALYKNHKTGKVLKDTFTKLKQTEIDLSAAKEKIAETQKKLDSISDVSVEEKKTGKFGKKLKKTGKKAWKKTKKTWKKTKKAFRNIGEKFSWSKDKTEKYSENNKYDSKAQKTIKKLQKKIDKLESDAAKNKNKYNVDSESGKEKNTGFWSKIKNIFTKSKDKTAEKTSKKSSDFSNVIDINAEKAKSEKEAAKAREIGEKYLDDEAAALRSAKEASDKRNEKWLEKEHARREKEYEKMWFDAEKLKAKEDKAKIRAEKDRIKAEKLKEKQEAKSKKGGFFSRMKNSIQSKWYERKLNKAYKQNQEPISEKNISSYEKTLRKATEKSDKCNEKWLEKEHAKKEKEYEKMWFDAEKVKAQEDKAKIRAEKDRIKAEKLKEKQEAKAKKVGFFSRIKNTIQTKWYERKLDKAYRQNQEPISEKNISSYEKTLRKATEKSDKRNEKWLAGQRAQEEKEYAKIWEGLEEPIEPIDEIEDIVTPKTGIFTRLKNSIQTKWYERKLDKAYKKNQENMDLDLISQEDAKTSKKILKSDARNERWLKNQRKNEEKEYAKIWQNTDLPAEEVEKKPKKTGFWKRFFSELLEDEF